MLEALICFALGFLAGFLWRHTRSERKIIAADLRARFNGGTFLQDIREDPIGFAAWAVGSMAIIAILAGATIASLH